MAGEVMIKSGHNLKAVNPGLDSPIPASERGMIRGTLSVLPEGHRRRGYHLRRYPEGLHAVDSLWKTNGARAPFVSGLTSGLLNPARND